uniref:ubiquitin carboxyl-terminal hydrolase 19 isoform X2 n=1 Tax=Myxine glutinosa TaxID=7769 RepID=UPI00358F1FD1
MARARPEAESPDRERGRPGEPGPGEAATRNVRAQTSRKDDVERSCSTIADIGFNAVCSQNGNLNTKLVNIPYEHSCKITQVQETECGRRRDGDLHINGELVNATDGKQQETNLCDHATLLGMQDPHLLSTSNSHFNDNDMLDMPKRDWQIECMPQKICTSSKPIYTADCSTINTSGRTICTSELYHHEFAPIQVESPAKIPHGHSSSHVLPDQREVVNVSQLNESFSTSISLNRNLKTTLDKVMEQKVVVDNDVAKEVQKENGLAQVDNSVAHEVNAKNGVVTEGVNEKKGLMAKGVNEKGVMADGFNENKCVSEEVDLEKTITKVVECEEQAEANQESMIGDVCVRAVPCMKHNWYEGAVDMVNVDVYVRNIDSTVTTAIFREADFTLVFRTSDTKFVQEQEDPEPSSLYSWNVRLRHTVVPERCHFIVRKAVITLRLKKQKSQRWGILEAPSSQGAVGGAKVVVPAGEQWQSGSGSQPQPMKSKSYDETGESRIGQTKKATIESGDSKLMGRTVGKTATQWDMHMEMSVSGTSCQDVRKVQEAERCRGYTGLVNLGNTCFMNSVIQCLSNTHELRDYFYNMAFKEEINMSNPLGTGGRLAKCFACLLHALWKGDRQAVAPSHLKSIVASKASQFTGCSQHDAQEFMAFLLDGLHEDLNRVRDKLYTPVPNSDSRPDQIVADEAWNQHKLRNDSFIVDLFQGQYKSKLVCPVCAKVSITFDPFLHLPVPLLQQLRSLSLFFFPRNPTKSPVRITVNVGKRAYAVEVTDFVAQKMHVQPDSLRLVEVNQGALLRVFKPMQPLENLTSGELLCFEVLSERQAATRVHVFSISQRLIVPNTPVTRCAACHMTQPSEGRLRRCTKCYRVAYCNMSCQKSNWSEHRIVCHPEPVGSPFLLSFRAVSLTYQQLAQAAANAARHFVKVTSPLETPTPSVITANEAQDVRDSPQLASLKVGPKEFDSASCDRQLGANHDKLTPDSCEETDVGGLRPETALSLPFNLYLKNEGKEVELGTEDGLLSLPEEANLVLEWCNHGRIPGHVAVETKPLLVEEEEEGAGGGAGASGSVSGVTLSHCLNLFTKPEVLAPEEAWFCPQCKTHRQASKQLLLWRLPNVLILQLKRFSFRNILWRDKINAMVDFPISGLDLSDYCIGSQRQSRPAIYDLYGVINHYGGLIGGHYTAFARLPQIPNSQASDIGWRLFDDSIVTAVEEDRVQTRFAYVLFYRCRNTPMTRLSSPSISANMEDKMTLQKMAFPVTSVGDGPSDSELLPEQVEETCAGTKDWKNASAVPHHSDMEEVD